ncbi:MAG TPA: class I SAM-dependent methyltransferase [Pyrinomonadaceae bacterium]|nr:class I SAM-dependent methyltransferase [Pyrinomonadaceae bacterium]
MRLVRGSLRRLLLKAKGNPRIDPLVSRLFEIWYDMPFAPAHYYSPLPNISTVKKNLPRWYKEDTSPGVDWNLPEQLALLEELATYSSELASLPAFSLVSQDGYGPGYGEIEAQLLYLMLRRTRPQKVVEIGSGVSTFYTLTALQANRERANVASNNVASSLTCIEPYPNDKLRALASERNVTLRECEVQDAGFEIFQDLSANDVLFIDSSHVSKKDSDVDFLFLEVLPRLRKDVLIHIHDISLPMPALPMDHFLFDTYLFWNENSLVKAFLLFNTAFRIVMCQSYLHHHRPDSLKTLLPPYNPQVHFPSSLWIRKVV